MTRMSVIEVRSDRSHLVANIGTGGSVVASPETVEASTEGERKQCSGAEDG